MRPTLVSVILPTHRRPDSLARVLAALDLQTLHADSYEVIVVCDGTDDPALEWLSSGQDHAFGLRVLSQHQSGPAAARNLGLSAAAGEYVVFVDDDVVPPPEFLERHLAAHQSDDRLAVIGPLMNSDDSREPWIRWESETLRRQYAAISAGEWSATWRQFHTGNASIRTGFLRSVGGFDVRFHRAEDIELGLRLSQAGVRFALLPGAAAPHLAKRSFASWIGIGYAYGKADVAIDALHPGAGILEQCYLEYDKRHPWTRRLVQIGVRHRWIVPGVNKLAMVGAILSAGFGITSLSLAVCSAVFNLAYWSGFSDAQGVAEPSLARLAPR